MDVNTQILTHSGVGRWRGSLGSSGSWWILLFIILTNLQVAEVDEGRVTYGVL